MLDLGLAEEADDGLLVLLPEGQVRKAKRVPVANDGVALLGESCGREAREARCKWEKKSQAGGRDRGEERGLGGVQAEDVALYECAATHRLQAQRSDECALAELRGSRGRARSLRRTVRVLPGGESSWVGRGRTLELRLGDHVHVRCGRRHDRRAHDGSRREGDGLGRQKGGSREHDI